MIYPKKTSILCRYGGELVEKSDKVSYKGGTNRVILFEAEEINYSILKSKLLKVCKLARIGRIKYKHPELGLDCLISIDDDEELYAMMQEFETQNGGLIHLFICEAQETLSIHNTIPSDKEIVNATEENHWGSKEMPLQPNPNTDINAKVADMPTDDLQLRMDHEFGMDNHNLPGNGSIEYRCANDTLLPSRMELEEGQEMSLQPNARTAGMPTDDLQVGMDHEFATDNHNLPRNEGIEYGCADDMLPSWQPRMAIDEGQETSLQPNSNMGINAEVGGMPADGLQSRMDCEFGMDNHNLGSNDDIECGCASDTLPPRKELKEGENFPDKDAFHKFLRQFAVLENFEYERTRSSTGSFVAKCCEKGCPWKIQALRVSKQSTFKITSLKGKHTCNLDKHLKRTSHRQATRKWIADIVERGNYFHCTPKVIADKIEKEYKVKVGYHKAWRGRELARKRRNSIGNSGQGYDSDYNIEKLCKDIRRTNPKSRVKLQRKVSATPWRFTVSSSGSDDSEEVDIRMRNCSCGAWQMHGYPCDHAMLVIRDSQLNVNDYWDDCYDVYWKAYSRTAQLIHLLRLKTKKEVDATLSFLWNFDD